jgi:hypothetical protein
MISYTKDSIGGFSCMYNGVRLGYIYQEVDGFYYLQPAVGGGFYSASILKDMAFKLDALNEAWKLHLEKLNVKT